MGTLLGYRCFRALRIEYTASTAEFQNSWLPKAKRAERDFPHLPVKPMAKKSNRSRRPSRKPTRSDADRRIQQADRLARVLKVLELIQGHGRWNARALAQELECKEQTIYRFLRVLEYAGVPFYFDYADGCYRVRHHVRFPVLNLSDDELLGQAVATAVTKTPGIAIPEAAATTRKLAATSSAEAKDILADAEKLISVLGLQLADHSKHHEIIRTVQWALLERKQISGRYRSPYETKPRTLRMHPFRLCLVKNAWYVIGKATQFDEVRTFRVARFQNLRMLQSPANIPEEFDLKEYFGNAWAVFRGTPSYDVKLRFSPQAAPVVTETIWHHTQKVNKAKDGSVTLSFTVDGLDGLDEILNWLLGWSGCVQVMEPAELRERFVERLKSAMAENNDC